MEGRISDGDLVTLSPVAGEDLAAGEIVLARVKGRRYFHLVLHLIHDCDGELFLIGSNNGRLDGWIGRDDIYGVVTSIESWQFKPR